MKEITKTLSISLSIILLFTNTVLADPVIDGRFLKTGSVSENKLGLTDITTGNSTILKHGFMPKLSGNSAEFLNGNGSWSTAGGAVDSVFGRTGAVTATSGDYTLNQISAPTTSFDFGNQLLNNVNTITSTIPSSSYNLNLDLQNHGSNSGQSSIIKMTRSNGTLAVPTAVGGSSGSSPQWETQIFGYKGTGGYAIIGGIGFAAQANFSNSSTPTSMYVYTTPSGSFSRVISGIFGANGNLTLAPTHDNLGGGSLYAKGVNVGTTGVTATSTLTDPIKGITSQGSYASAVLGQSNGTEPVPTGSNYGLFQNAVSASNNTAGAVYSSIGLDVAGTSSPSSGRAYANLVLQKTAQYQGKVALNISASSSLENKVFEIAHDGAGIIGKLGAILTSLGSFIVDEKLGVGTTGIHASAKVQIDSVTQGFLPTRMTTAQKNAISSPAIGLIVYDTDLNKLCVYTGSWETVTSS